MLVLLLAFSPLGLLSGGGGGLSSRHATLPRCFADSSAVSARPRRSVLGLVAAITAASLVSDRDTALALVKGSAPPPSKGARSRPACSSIDECQAIGDVREAELFVDINPALIKKTAAGDRFFDIQVGTGPVAVGEGSVAQIKYRVLRQGKRSQDGLSGEGSTIFSHGYGEDEDKEGDLVALQIGSGKVIAALDAGLRGMRAGGRRRINVRPERGWKMPDESCLTTITDAVLVPTSKVQQNDACFDTVSIPTPSNYAASRRMLRRYDETLIFDCELVDVLTAA